MTRRRPALLDEDIDRLYCATAARAVWRYRASGGGCRCLEPAVVLQGGVTYAVRLRTTLIDSVSIGDSLIAMIKVHMRASMDLLGRYSTVWGETFESLLQLPDAVPWQALLLLYTEMRASEDPWHGPMERGLDGGRNHPRNVAVRRDAGVPSAAIRAPRQVLPARSRRVHKDDLVPRGRAARNGFESRVCR